MRLILKARRPRWFVCFQMVLSPVQQMTHTDVLGFGFTFTRITHKAIAIWFHIPVLDVGLVWA